MSSTPITREQWKLMAVLSLFWGTLFGALGIFFPYYSLYLKEDLGLTGQQVGTAMGVFHLIGLIGQPVWGYIADRTGSVPLDRDCQQQKLPPHLGLVNTLAELGHRGQVPPRQRAACRLAYATSRGRGHTRLECGHFVTPVGSGKGRKGRCFLVVKLKEPHRFLHIGPRNRFQLFSSGGVVSIGHLIANHHVVGQQLGQKIGSCVGGSGLGLLSGE